LQEGEIGTSQWGKGGKKTLIINDHKPENRSLPDFPTKEAQRVYRQGGKDCLLLGGGRIQGDLTSAEGMLRSENYTSVSVQRRRGRGECLYWRLKYEKDGQGVCSYQEGKSRTIEVMVGQREK